MQGRTEVGMYYSVEAVVEACIEKGAGRGKPSLQDKWKPFRVS